MGYAPEDLIKIIVARLKTTVTDWKPESPKEKKEVTIAELLKSKNKLFEAPVNFFLKLGYYESIDSTNLDYYDLELMSRRLLTYINNQLKIRPANPYALREPQKEFIKRRGSLMDSLALLSETSKKILLDKKQHKKTS